MTQQACDFTPGAGGRFTPRAERDTATEQPSGEGSALYRFLRTTFTWEGVNPESYGGLAGVAGVVRNVIVGGHGESIPFDLRYFEMGPACSSEPVQHPREHVVIGVRGKGTALVGRRTVELNPLDVLYIASGELHQITNREEQPFGFFCIISVDREPVAELLQDELDWLQQAATAKGVTG